MKITILSHSDITGGAAVVTLRLLNALRQAGIDARMLVMHKGSDNPYVEQVGPRWRAKACFLRERAGIFVRNSFSRSKLFKVSTANCGLPLSKHPLVKDADVVILGWVNQGLISLREISRIKVPVAWVMHDMWCLTGICHHAGACRGYYYSCGNCPMLHRGRATEQDGGSCTDLSWSTRARKEALYASKHITFVAISRWLAERCKKSSLLTSETVRVIPNAFPVEDFYITPRKSRAEMGLPASGKLIAMGAARLDDPIKGLDLAIEALNQLADSGCAAVFFGSLKNPHALDALQIPYVHLGPIDDPEHIREIYAHCCAVLSSSHYETLPTTLIEGMAAGCVPVTFGQGGQADIVEHLDTGYIALYPDSTDLAAGLRFALSGEIPPERLRQSVEDKFGAKAVAQRYIDLAHKMLADRQKA